jgi:hypothetical protein
MPNATMNESTAAFAARWNSRSARAGTIVRSMPTRAPTKALTTTSSENCGRFSRRPSRMGGELTASLPFTPARD